MDEVARNHDDKEGTAATGLKTELGSDNPSSKSSEGSSHRLRWSYCIAEISIRLRRGLSSRHKITASPRR